MRRQGRRRLRVTGTLSVTIKTPFDNEILARSRCSRPLHCLSRRATIADVRRVVGRGLWLGCLLSVSVACGTNATNSVDGSGGSNSNGGSNSSGGSRPNGGGNSNGGSNSSGGSNASAAGASGGNAPSEPCDCSTRDCRPPQEVVAESCKSLSSMSVWTYTERADCDYILVRYDYDRGDRTYYYEAQGTLVGLVADNAFANGFSTCGLIPSCTGAIVQECRLCRGSAFTNDNLPDCPATIWNK